MSTPIMQQYKQIKAKHKDSLLFFRLGDFYELFYEDAKIAAQTLNITLTKRTQKNEDIPMAGVPFHTSDYYIAKLIKGGYKVAICEQVGNELNQNKIINRKVVEILTPGTIQTDTILENKRNNFLISIHEENLKISLAILDITTNEFKIEEIESSELKSLIEKIDPSEILISQKLYLKFKDDEIDQKKITMIQEIEKFQAESIILEFFKLHSKQSIEYLNSSNQIAIANILEYIRYTKKQIKFAIKLPQKNTTKEEVELDVFTRKNLEITKTLQNKNEGSLLSFLDKTQTAQGGRKLYQTLTNPINNIEKLNQRYDSIEFFVKNQDILQKTRELLRYIPDFERLFTKIVYKKATPNQLYQLTIGIEKTYQLCEFLNQETTIHKEVLNEILSAIDSTAPNTNNSDQQYILKNYNEELDEWKDFSSSISKSIENLESEYKEKTNINTLRIKNTPFGFLIEINNNHTSKLGAEFQLKQTLKTASRFSTEKLNQLNIKYLQSENFIKNKEQEIFINLCSKIEEISESIFEYGEITAEIDIFSNLGLIAYENQHIRPIMTTDNDFEIKQGKHPIISKILEEKGDVFVANDCSLTQNVLFMTGPNMAGKSTYLRQQAIICLLAHCGIFVPCSYAKIGIVDQIFSRISTNDDLSKGNSTFMVEMIEISLTLNRATNKSFLILDEVGRGTSVEEGIALAEAILYYLLDQLNARTLFATHYLSLGKIEHPKIQKKMMKIITSPLTFKYQMIDGISAKSYALEIAKLAGMPYQIIERAEKILKNN